ncbi:MAG: hypothetical protein ACP5NS_03610 [Candidatus Pacearchaeota archaeon]
MFGSKKCERCTGKLKDEFSFCPFCGLDLRNPTTEARDFGMLGKNDSVFGAPMLGGGATGLPGDFSNIFAQVMKMMEGQIKNMNPENLDFGDSKPEVRRLPNGFQIKIGPAMQQHNHKQKAPEVKPRVISEEQRARMVKLPRAEAKTQVRRLSDKVIYELVTPGVETTDDIFVSKVESGYEVKAVGNKKVYLNSLQIDLPIKKYSVKDNRVTIEFGLE